MANKTGDSRFSKSNRLLSLLAHMLQGFTCAFSTFIILSTTSVPIATAAAEQAQADGIGSNSALPEESAHKSTITATNATKIEPGILRLSLIVQQSEHQSSTPLSPSERLRTAESGRIDLILITSEGEPIGRSVPIRIPVLIKNLKSFYRQMSRQESLELEDPQSPSRQLYDILIRPIEDELKARSVNTLLLAAGPGLQAIPYAALHDGSSFLGTRLAFSLTPSLSLTPMEPTEARQQGAQQTLAGATTFDGLAPLPLVEQELEAIHRDSESQNIETQRYVNSTFTPGTLLTAASNSQTFRVHIATHAEFLPGGPKQSKIYTGVGPMTLDAFAKLRERRADIPIDLFVLSACRTALGDSDSELGFSGLALQAGARSAVGSIWYVDDVATSAFLVQFYRLLERGVPKAQAIMETRYNLALGKVRLINDQLLDPEGDSLLSGLTALQQQRIRSGLVHPFFWAGINLMGTPW